MNLSTFGIDFGKMSNPILSVLLPNYNNAPYLKDCLDSLYSQTFQDFVIYFVDDCSTDNSVEIAKSYSQDKMVIVQKTRNTGIVDTLNTGLDLVVTKYFIRMDGDDISHPERFEKLTRFMEMNLNVGVCSSAIKCFGSSDQLLTYELNSDLNKASLIFGHSLGHASCIFRTSVLKQNEIRYKDDYLKLEDYFLFYRLKDYTQFTSLNEPLYSYRRAEYNTNSKLVSEKKQEYLKLYSMIFSDFGKEVNNFELNIHMELAKQVPPSNRFNHYVNHVKILLELNSCRQLFPQAELKQILHRALVKMAYRLADLRQIRFIEAIQASKYNLNILRYYLMNKLKN